METYIKYIPQKKKKIQTYWKFELSTINKMREW